MTDDIFEKLILEGVIEVSAIDADTAEFLYSFTPKVKEKYPELYNELQTHISKEMMSLWQDGFVHMDITENNPLVSLTEKAFIEEEIQKLDNVLQHSLAELKRITAKE